MAKAHIDMSVTELSNKVMADLETRLGGKTFSFKTSNPDLDLDGKFVDTTPWQSKLWDTIVAESGVKSPAKPRKTTSNLEEPGSYNVELELWDRVIKFKVAIAAPSTSDKAPRAIKPNSAPPHVKVHIKGANMANCPTTFVNDLKDLVKQMGKTGSYAFTTIAGSGMGWKPKFNKHKSHLDPGHGWKAYIDEPSMSTGSTWRLRFNLDFHNDSKTLNVNITDVFEGH